MEYAMKVTVSVKIPFAKNLLVSIFMEIDQQFVNICANFIQHPLT